MTKILLTRHGHVEGIFPERFRGRAELALTKKGVAEAEALAARIVRAWKPAVVYTSALQRCVVTGTIIANVCGAKAIPLEGLMDIDYGAWQMRSHEEIKAEAPEAYRRWRVAPQRMRFPDGESLLALDGDCRGRERVDGRAESKTGREERANTRFVRVDPALLRQP